MKQNLIFSAVIILLLAGGCQPGQQSMGPDTIESYETIADGSAGGDVVPVTPESSPAPSCAYPTPAMIAGCQAQAAQILQATVRIELRYWLDDSPVDGGMLVEGASHATLVNGQYLVTHNHFPISLREAEAESTGAEVRIDVFSVVSGEAVIQAVPLRKLDIVAEDRETLVLDFGEMGQALFRVFAVQSLPLAAGADINLQPGTEVAQINWDGVTTRVDWVQVLKVNEEDGVPQIVLASSVRKGASGGGIFWNGMHVGNNWSTNTVRTIASGETVAAFSIAAANTGQIR